VLLLLPGPGAVLSAAWRARATAAALVGLPARALALASRAERALDQVEALLDAATALLARADLVAARADLVSGRAEEVTVDAARVTRAAGAVTAQTQVVLTAAARTERAAAGLVGAYGPMLAALQPTLERLAETLDPREVDAMVGMVDRLPHLLDAVDNDILPLLSKLNQMAPDVHALLEAVDDVRRAIVGLPGINILMRRGEEELAAADSEPGHGQARPSLPGGEGRVIEGATRIDP
jgi:ABC-type transporter Mla subunit MlaD